MKKQNIRELLVREDRLRKQIISPVFLEIGLTPGQGQARILNRLLDKDQVTQKELGNLCHFDAPTMSRNIDKLEKMGFLTREINPECRRSFLICLTKLGRRKAQEIRTTFDQFDEILLDEIGVDDLDIFCRVLSKMCDNMEKNKYYFNKIESSQKDEEEANV